MLKISQCLGRNGRSRSSLFFLSAMTVKQLHVQVSILEQAQPIDAYSLPNCKASRTAGQIPGPFCLVGISGLRCKPRTTGYDANGRLRVNLLTIAGMSRLCFSENFRGPNR